MRTMKWVTNTSSSTATANVALTTLMSEAQSLYAQAEKYRKEMENLPANDPQRKVYEQVILDLLSRAQSLSLTVTSTASSSR